MQLDNITFSQTNGAHSASKTKMKEFENELTHLINRHSIENEVDMPDFLLAGMICRMIEAMGPGIKKTLDWHGCDSVCHPSPNIMEPPYAIDRLDVIAFANRLDPAMLPTVVAPVFRDRERPDQAIFPPFRFDAGNVVGGTTAPAEEIADLEGQGKATLLKEPIPARRGFELWVDEGMNPHYEPAKEVGQKLREIALAAARQARQALVERRLEDAERLLARALSADDRPPDVLALAAALGSVQDNQARIVLMKRAAERLGMQDSFEDAFKKILEDVKKGSRANGPGEQSKLAAGSED
jgi:hypothetical protein